MHTFISTSLLALALVSCQNMNTSHASADESSPLFKSAARGVVKCVEVAKGYLPTSEIDETGACGASNV